MKKNHIIKALCLSILSIVAVIAYAEKEKVIQVYKNGEIIQEFIASEIDYIEVNDLIPSPENVNAVISNNEITVTWNAVDNATYNVYRSPDNINFTLLASDINGTTYTDKTPLSGSNYYRVTAVIDDNESKYTQSVSANYVDPDLPSGIYLGIYGFSKGLQTHPIEHLSENNISAYHSFINSLSATEPFTWLYYAVDKSVDKLQQTQFPKDLSKVAIVTFTDGLDIGSLDEKDKENPDMYLTNSEYREALHTRLNNEKVSDTPISAYTIGIIEGKGASLTTFKNNMNSLATSSANVFEVSKIENLNQIFQQVANSLSETNYVQRFVLSISGQSHNEKCKFTFDNVTSHLASKLYIEGTYDRQSKSLTNITYEGLTSSSGTVVKGIYNDTDGKYDFTFDDLQSNDGSLIPTDHVNHWFTDEGIWQDVDDEFFFSPDDASIQKIKRSAAIMLNLDCSKSMNGEKFAKLQEAANSFVQKLADNSIDPSEVSSVSLNKTSLTLQAGNSEQLHATVLPATAKLKTVTWSSSNTSVATVDENGYVSAVAPGNATITVTTKDGGFTATCQVKVVTLVQKIELNPQNITMYVDESININATVIPGNATNKELIWSSSNQSIATVSGNVIKAIAPGNASITAYATDNSGISATVPVSVLQHVESVTIQDTEIYVLIGGGYQLETTVSPMNASNKNLHWTSSDESIAKVDQNGFVTPVSRGKAVITATSEDGNLSCECIATIAQPITAIKLNQTSAKLNVGETLQLSAIPLPDDADNKNLIWNSTNSAIATVSSTGLVTAITPGTTDISVTGEETGIKTKCTVTINQPLSGISLSSNSITIGKGETATLKVSPIPSDASNSKYSVTSSNTSVATVTYSGLNIVITAVGLGSSTITVKSEEGNYTATAEITVTPSTTPQHLALAIKKDGTIYYIPLNEYTSLPSGYTKAGLTINYGGSSFILALNNVTQDKKTFSAAQSLGTLPTSTQANAIYSNWSSVNSALSKYGGTSLGSNSYWTSTPRGSGNVGYYYSSSGVSSTSSPNDTKYVRCIIATL